ncbi:MAG: aldo/keto reductase [Betaproteobacteria bacterium]|nr:aldo/keto reductase [Betaproteobacteria bacterium]MBK7080542.1 aldo/keto reductase [Betaproteobacteria bacterium]
MRYRMFGRTGLFVSELCFGSMTFGGKTGIWEKIGNTEQQEADRLVGVALDAGINFFDTADSYADGDSERILGKALGARRRDVVLASKVRSRVGPGPNQVGLSRAHIVASVDASLRRLGTDWLDLYQIHGYDAATPLDETMRALDDLVRAGKLRYVGCSNVAAWHIAKANGLAAAHDWSRFESLQAYYTIAARDIERELVPLLADQQMALMVWSPLAGGLLSGKFSRDADGPPGSRRAVFDFPLGNRERAFDCVDAMRPIAAAHGVSVARVALAWLLAQSQVTTIIIGAKNEEQLRDNLDATTLLLAADELAALERVSALPIEYPGWMIARQAIGREPTAT